MRPPGIPVVGTTAAPPWIVSPAPRPRASRGGPPARENTAPPPVAAPPTSSRGVDLYSRLPMPGQLVRHGLEWLATASRGVTLHTDDTANQTARRFNADAVAWGEHIFIRDGRFEPATPRGLALLSHELVHVIQHRNAVAMTASGDSLAGDHHEREALAVERTVLALMRPHAGVAAQGMSRSSTRLAAVAATAAAAPRAVPAIPLRAAEERSVEPATAQGPATDPAELAKEVYKLFERRLRVERERVGMGRV
jgi:Domain of unknown function (DUF4157)